MAKSRETFNKKEKEKLRQKKKQEKVDKKEARKSNDKSTDFEDMIAYVDEFGNISDTPPELPVEKKFISNQSNQNRVKNNQNFKNLIKDITLNMFRFVLKF